MKSNHPVPAVYVRRGRRSQSAAIIKAGKARRAVRPPRRGLTEAMLAEMRPGLERDTQLMPWLIAETVCGEVSQILGLDLPVRYAVWLEAKAELCYSGHRHFHKLMRGRGNAPRDWLYVFMRHWLGSLLQLERPDLCRCLPMSFAYGQRLPRGMQVDFIPAPCGWDPSRVTRHRSWAWLARRGLAEVAERRTAADQQMEAFINDFYPKEIRSYE